MTMAMTWGALKAKLDEKLNDESLVEEIVCFTISETDEFRVTVSPLPFNGRPNVEEAAYVIWN